MSSPVSTPESTRTVSTPVSHLSGTQTVSQRGGVNYALVAALVIMALVIGYQQTQLTKISSELGVVSGDMRSGETRGRLEALDSKLQELNTRLTYLDSKIVATDEKAQAAMDRIKEDERKADWFGNILRGFGWK